MLRTIARHRVADRPGRIEPRMAKRRAKNDDRLMKPRMKIKRDMIKWLIKIYVPFVGSTEAISEQSTSMSSGRRAPDGTCQCR
jgi:hypothetical protein